MHSRPEISVLISTFNDRALVGKKLAEIQRQTVFERAEFLFLETGSGERERELLAPFCDGHPNCRLITRDERLTLYEAWNLGWQEASAPVLCISNMDDSMHPRLLETVIEEMTANDWEIGSVFIARQDLDDPRLNSWEPGRLRRLRLQFRPGAFFFWRRDLIGKVGSFDSGFHIAGDKDFWARAVHRGLRMGLIPQVLYLYTIHPGQLSKSDRFRALKDEDRARADGKDYPHIWPVEIVRKVRRAEKFGKIPFLGARKRFVDC